MKPVHASDLLRQMCQLAPTAPYKHTFQETSEAIASACNAAPLFSDEDGAVKSAMILIAISRSESLFNPSAIGDGGKTFGAWLLPPPTPDTMANVLLLPKTAAIIALNMIRTELALSGNFPWDEKTGWSRGAERGKQPRIQLAEKLYQDSKRGV